MFPVDGKNNESESKAQKNAVPDPDREIREWGVDLQKILVYEIWSKNKGGRGSCPGSATEINDARKSSATSRRSNGTDLCSLEDCTGTRVFDKITQNNSAIFFLLRKRRQEITKTQMKRNLLNTACKLEYNKDLITKYCCHKSPLLLYKPFKL